MNLKNKKGFITVYVMLAMMFFVVFVVTASVTASRKLKLQTEANSALYDIYSEDIDYIIQDTTTIPIYTQKQFLQIMSWFKDTSRKTEYMYINDVIYTLDSSKSNEYYFILKTDIWLKGSDNTDGIGDSDEKKKEDKEKYPFIPEIHETYQGKKDKIEKSGHNIYLQVNTNMYVYDVEMIDIATAEDFLKIGTGQPLSNGIPATANLNYEIVKSISIPNGGEFTRAKVGEFTGKITTKDDKELIIDGLTLTNGSLFENNKGTIENLTFTTVTASNIHNIENFGIIAEENSGTISNCNIMLKKDYDNENSITPNNIENISCTGSLGCMVGVNSGTILNCNIQGINISKCSASNIGGVVGLNNKIGLNEVKISNITVNGKIQISESSADNIGGISGSNSAEIEKVQIKSNIVLETANNTNIGGIVGNNSGIISKILIDGQPGENENNYGNITINNTTTNANVGLVTGNNSNAIQNCIVNGYITSSGGNVGGISGYLSGNISNCYSNVKIENSATTGAIGGIVGNLYSGTINQCAYINEIQSIPNIPIGGIVGIVGILNTANSPTIQSCYMNGVIPTNSKSGAVIGTITGTSGKINAGTDGTDGTSDYPVYYNQAFRWIGYASTLTGITLNYNCEAKDSSALSTSITNLKGTILSYINSLTN